MVTEPNLNDGTWVVRGTGDLDPGVPDGDDLLLQNVSTDELVLWKQTGGEITAQVDLPAVDGFTAIAFADFDGDGMDDVFYRNLDTTTSNRVFLSSTQSLSTVAGFHTDLVLRGIADLDRDGTDDHVWQHSGNGNLVTRLIDTGANTFGAYFASGYGGPDQLLGVYNTTDPDTFDALWWNDGLGRYETVSYIDGTRTVDGTFTLLPGQEFLSSGDFNGDGIVDFAFIDPAGSDAGSAEVVFASQSNLESHRFTYDGQASEFGTKVSFSLAGDFDGDGTLELAAVDANGRITIYDVQGGLSSATEEELTGSKANDAIDGNAGDDRLFGQEGDDLLLGDQGNDVVFGQSGRDLLFGGDNDDSLFGGAGDDEIDSGAGEDLSSGGAGDDFIFSHQGILNGTSFADGNDGDDYLLSAEGGHLRGGPGNDLLEGGIFTTIMEGNDGDDYLIGGGSADRLFGGDDNDFLLGNAGQDTLFGGDGDDILIGNTRGGTSISTDTFYGGSGRDYFYLAKSDFGFYESTGAAVIKDYSTSLLSGDFLVLEGSQGNYTFTDTGSTIEIDVAASGDLVATIDTNSPISQLQDTVIYI